MEQLIHGKYYVSEQDLDWLLLRDMVEVGEGIDLEQELSVIMLDLRTIKSCDMREEKTIIIS